MVSPLCKRFGWRTTSWHDSVIASSSREFVFVFDQRSKLAFVYMSLIKQAVVWFDVSTVVKSRTRFSNCTKRQIELESNYWIFSTWEKWKVEFTLTKSTYPKFITLLVKDTKSSLLVYIVNLPISNSYNSMLLVGVV